MIQQSQMNLHKNNNNKKLSQSAYVDFQLTQHSFQSQREQTHHSFESQSSITLQNSRDSFHMTNIEFHINNPIRELLYEFKNMLKDKGYKCCQIFQNQLYIVRLCYMDKLKKLFLCKQPPKYILSIRTHQFRSVRIVNIRPMTSCNPSPSLSNSSKQIQHLLQYLLTSCNLNKPLSNQQMNELDSQYKQDIYSLDATSNYMFSKMLVDKNYSIGKRIEYIIEYFKRNYQKNNHKKQDKKYKFSQLVYLNQAIDQITQEMLQGFNCSRKQLYEILCYCRKSIQNYFYTSLQQQNAQSYIQSQQHLQISIATQVFSNTNIKQTKQLSQKQQQNNKIIQSDFHKYYPKSIKQLKKLLISQISIQIFKHIYLLIEFIKIQTVLNKIQENIKGQFLIFIKNNFIQVIIDKIRRIRAAGFTDVYFEAFLKQLKLEE